MADRATYLSHFTADYIGRLCELNNIDVNKIKTKEERIDILCQLPKMNEESAPTSTTSKPVGMSLDDLARVMQEVESSRNQETRQLCESLMKIAVNKPSRNESDLPGLHRLTGDDDISCYLSTFERIASGAGRPKEEWPKLLEPYLTGKAQQAFHSLDTERTNYDAVVQAIRRRYQLTPEAYRLKFKNDAKRGEETFEEFANRLQEHFYRWVEIPHSSLAVPDVNRCLNLVMIDQFLSTIADEVLRLKLRERNESSLIALACIADELLLHRRANVSVREDVGPRRRNSPPHPPVGRGGMNPGRRGTFNQSCHRCGQLGHWKADCPMPSHQPTFFSPTLPPTPRFMSPHQPTYIPPTPKPGTASPQKPNDCNFITPNHDKMVHTPGIPVKQGLPMLEVTLKGEVGVSMRTHGLLDTGSTVSLVSMDLCKELSLPVTPCNQGEILKMVDGTPMVPKGRTSVEVEVGSSVACIQFQVVPFLPAPVLLGMDFAQEVHLSLDFSEGWYGTGGGTGKPLKFPLLGVQPTDLDDTECEIDADHWETRPGPCGAKLEATPMEHSQLEAVLDEFQDVLSDSPGFTMVDCHRIDVGDATPVRSHPYRMSPERKMALDEEISKLLQSGKIEPSSSPWASPVVMVPKKGGTYRMCIDYRKLNSATKIDAYPMPTVDDILSSLHGAKVFSSLDLKSGYWQMGVAPDDYEKTAFICEQGLFHFRVLPFGVVNGPASFQRLMHKVLGDLVGRCCYVYLDDIVCYSTDVTQHLVDLQSVFHRLRAAGLTVNVEKCQFLHQEMRYLGHVISADGLKPDPDKVSAIQGYVEPTSVKELERFLGLLGWYQKFIPGFADRAAPLYRLKKKDVKWEWSEECSAAFRVLKNALTIEPVLGYPDQTSPFVVHTDASDVGLGAVLTQKQGSETRTIAFASRSLSSAEKNYSTTEKECLAVIWALEKWRPYLEGRPCKVVTDHQALCWLFRKRKQTGRLARWVLRLQDYCFQVVYRPGSQHHVPDALSRSCGNPGLVGVVEEMPTDPDDEHGEKCADPNCRQPQNDIIDWVFCEHCRKWYHQSCVSVTAEEAERIEHYSCPYCQEKERLDKGATDYTNLAPGLSRDTVYEAQRRDATLLPAIMALEKRQETDANDENSGYYVLKDGLLFRKDGCLVVPGELRKTMLMECHTKPHAGHLGRRKTLARLKYMKLCWKGMTQTVRSFVRACKVCQKSKPCYQKKPGKMLSTTSSKPWEIVGVDLMGPFPKSYGGHEYILVAVDHYTKFTEVIPLKSASSQTVACTLVRQLFCRYGPPTKLLSDNGPQFRGKALAAVCAEWGVEQVFITPYHPQTNWVERVNRNLKAMLQAYVSGDHRAWDLHLAEFSFALNTSLHDTIGVEPALLMFGRRLNSPLPNKLNMDASQGVNRPSEEDIASCRRHASQASKRHYDKRRSEVLVKTGDRVRIKTYPISNAKKCFTAKLAPRWTETFLITKQLTPVNFEAVSEKNKNLTRIVHVDQLKICLDK